MLKALITTLAITALFSQPILAQSAPWADANPGFPGGVFAGGEFPVSPVNGVPSGSTVPGAAFPGGSMQPPPGTPGFLPWPYWLPRGKSTGRGVGRRFNLPPTSTSSVDLDIVDGGGGGNSNPPPASQIPPQFILGPRTTVPLNQVFPGGPGPDPGLFSGGNPGDGPQAN